MESTLQEIIQLLETALDDRGRLPGVIFRLQQQVWSSSVPMVPALAEELLQELAYDLDFYEPDAKARAEDPSFKDEAAALEEIRRVVLVLRELR